MIIIQNQILKAVLSILLLAFYACQENTGLKDANSIQNDDSTIAKVSEKTKQPNTEAMVYSLPEIPVLCYHRIADGKKGDYTVSVGGFKSHLQMLADSGYHSVSPQQLYDYLVFNTQLPAKPFLITFDDSRVEHFTIAAPMLESYGFRGSFFIMTITYNKKNYMTTQQIDSLDQKGHTIGLHSWDHTMVTKYVEEAQWLQQVAEPKKKLEGITGSKVDFWAYPNGVYNHESAEKLGTYFKLSFSLSTKRDSLVPLQCVRRIIVPECSPEALLKSMRRNFKQPTNV
jgi:peptidoglycan/xylan/chitin deacetylase (PgdA/CDA1 family)